MLRNLTRALIVVGICAEAFVVFGSETKQDKVAAFQKQYERVMSGKGEGGKFLGTRPCRACHTTKKVGAQFKIWQKGPHAKAYQALLSDKGKERAAAKNIAKPEEDKNCLQCHAPVSVLPKELVSAKYQRAEGVGCEVCHGPGEKHVQLQKKAMKERTEVPEGQRAVLKVSDPDLRNVLCGRCHKQHEWHEMEPRDNAKAWEKIAHPRPKK